MMSESSEDDVSNNTPSERSVSSRRSSKASSKKGSIQQEYSWDRKEKIDPKDFTIENLENGESGRLPGKVNGQQFIIQNCKHSNIYVFDHINTITIDDCQNCKLFLGPVKGSVFLRNCIECVCIVACGQFRTRDCRKLDVFLCCATQPIIESSTGVHVGCYQFYYPELETQFHNAGLSPFNNNWSNIHDFTPVEMEQNWSTFNEAVTVEEYLPKPQTELASVDICMKAAKSIVPYTGGEQYRNHQESALVILFCDGQQHQRAMSYIQAMKELHSDCPLVMSQEVTLQVEDAERLFRTSSYAAATARGPLIGLQYSGPQCIKQCQTVAMDIATSTGSTGLVYVSSNPKVVQQQISTFFTYTQIQLG